MRPSSKGRGRRIWPNHDVPLGLAGITVFRDIKFLAARPATEVARSAALRMNEHEETIVRPFIASARRTRWLESLASSKRRPRMLDRLNHCQDLDERYATMLPSNADVVALLRSRGAPATCYVLSCTDDIDGQVLPLDEAVSAAELGGWGTIISCIPGRLAYYYDECGARRMLLERPSPK